MPASATIAPPPVLGESSASSMSVQSLMLTKKNGLILDQDADGEFDPGDRVRYSLDFYNNGDVEATGVEVQDEYPQELLV